MHAVSAPAVNGGAVSLLWGASEKGECDPRRSPAGMRRTIAALGGELEVMAHVNGKTVRLRAA